MSQGYYLQGVCLGRTMQEEENVTGELSVADEIKTFGLGSRTSNSVRSFGSTVSNSSQIAFIPPPCMMSEAENEEFENLPQGVIKLLQNQYFIIK